MAVEYLPAQIDSTSSTVPLPYTSSPMRMLWADVKLFFHYAYALPGIVIPLGPYPSGPLDEMYPSMANTFDITLHMILILMQLVFLLSIPLCLFLPVPLGIFALFVAVALSMNHAICRILNGRKPILESNMDVSAFPDRDDERWIFQNGVAVGYVTDFHSRRPVLLLQKARCDLPALINFQIQLSFLRATENDMVFSL